MNEAKIKELKDNKNVLIQEKKATVKKADAVISYYEPTTDKGIATKTLKAEDQTFDKLKVKIVINTTNLLDSHSDVHMKGIWNKSLKENKNILHVQEHALKFDHIISDEVKASAQDMLWSEIGEKYQGSTQALIFDSVIDMNRNKFMFDQYLKGYVKQHSVGMRYVKIFLCINSEDKYYAEEKEDWDKYIGNVANIDAVNEQGYFWAVTEAKIVEGSAVVLGSNSATPTINTEPSKDTQEAAEKFTADNFKEELTKQFKNLKLKS